MAIWSLLIEPVAKVLDTVLSRVLPAEKMSDKDRAELSLKIQQEVFRESLSMYGKEIEDMASARALAQVEAQNSGSIGKLLSGIFRPVTGFSFLGMYLWAKLSIQLGLTAITLTPQDYYLFGGIMAFYFGLRHREKVNGTA